MPSRPTQSEATTPGGDAPCSGMYDDYDAAYHVLMHAPARHLRAYANVNHAFRAAALYGALGASFLPAQLLPASAQAVRSFIVVTV